MEHQEIVKDLFKKDLTNLLNSHCIENECDMPDFLLAELIIGFIKAVGGPIKKTLDWHGCDSVCHPKQDIAEKHLTALLVEG